MPIEFETDVAQPSYVENGVITVRIGTPAYIVHGFSVNIVCNVIRAELPVTISWLRNGKFDLSRGNFSIITVTDATDDDVFTCRASNKVQAYEKSTTIIFVHIHFCIVAS